METIYFSASKKAFYSESLHPVRPDDALEITAAEHAAAMSAQQAGSSIGVSAQGRPVVIPAPLPTLNQIKLAAVAKIEADSDAIYQDVVGNKGEEYRDAEADAKAFAAAGYVGAAGSGVTSWATAKNWTNTQAANDIITQASAWRSALAVIRANRLCKKEAVKVATDAAAVDAVVAQWDGFNAAMRGQLGI